MLKPTLMTPLEQQIDAALNLNLAMLKAGFFECLAALLLLLIAALSLFCSVVRMVAAGLGLLLWAVALFVTFLSWVRGLALSRTSSIQRDSYGS